MKTYTICGSMRFASQMKEIAWELESVHGFNILQCVYNEKNSPINEKTLETLAKLHYKKIDLSDGIYIVDLDGYIGSAVKLEIEYANNHGKEVIFHSDFSGQKAN